MPNKWFTRGGATFAKAWPLHPTLDGTGWVVHEYDEIDVSTCDILHGFHAFEHARHHLRTRSGQVMPSPYNITGKPFTPDTIFTIHIANLEEIT